MREARLKPEQITALADGELLAVEGIDSAGLEEIRAHYPTETLEPQTNQKPAEVKPEKNSAKGGSASGQKSASSRSRHPRTVIGRSRLYRTQKDKLKVNLYPLSTAVKMLREISYSTHKTVELHLNTKDATLRGELSLPHSMGKQTRIIIFTPEQEAKIKAGKIEFDILLAKPADMARIAPLAKVLGPKGLMPNPKNNTIVADPEKRKAEMEKGALLTYRTEAKNPIIHLAIGNLDQKDK